MYQPILAELSDLGYQCKLSGWIFGRFGHVQNLVFSGLRLEGLSFRKIKTTSKVVPNVSSDRQPCSVAQGMFFVPLNKALSHL